MCWSVATGAKVHQTQAHNRPDTNDRLDDAENNDDSGTLYVGREKANGLTITDGN